MDPTMLQDKIDDATLDFTLGDASAAISKLSQLASAYPESFATWHALTEVYFSERQYDKAVSAAEKALKLAPEDIHIHTSLSRIWMERGDKKRPSTMVRKLACLGGKSSYVHQRTIKIAFSGIDSTESDRLDTP